MRQGYLSDSEVLGRCVAMQSVPLGRPDLAVRVGNRVIYPQNAQMMYSNLRFDRETKLNLISDYVDRSRAQPQVTPPTIPVATPPPGSEDGRFSDSGDTPLESLPSLNDEEEDGFSTPPEVRPVRLTQTGEIAGTRPPSFSPSVYQPFRIPPHISPGASGLSGNSTPEPRSPDADQPTGDSPIGRARDEVGRQGRNILLDRRNSAFAGSVRGGMSRGFATLRDVFSSPTRIAPSSQPQAELSQETTERQRDELGRVGRNFLYRSRPE